MRPADIHLLPLEPFRAWAEGRVRAHGSIYAWACALGVDGTWLRRYVDIDTPGAYHDIALDVADQLLIKDGTARLEDVWPGLDDDTPLEPDAYCPRCRELVTPIDGCCPWCESATGDSWGHERAYCEAEDMLVMPAVDGSCWRCGGPLTRSMPYDPCACGCGQMVNRFEPWRGHRVRYVRGHASRDLARGTMVPAEPFREHLLRCVRDVDPLSAVALQHSMKREEVAAILAGDVDELDRQDVRDHLWRASRYGQTKGRPNRIGIPRLGDLYPEYVRSKTCPGVPEYGIEGGHGKSPQAELCKRCRQLKMRRERGLCDPHEARSARWRIGEHVLAEAKRLREAEALSWKQIAERLQGQTPHKNARSLAAALRDRFRRLGWDMDRLEHVPDEMAQRALELRFERNLSFDDLGELFAGELGVPPVTATARLYRTFRARGWNTHRRTKGLPRNRTEREAIAA